MRWTGERRLCAVSALRAPAWGASAFPVGTRRRRRQAENRWGAQVQEKAASETVSWLTAVAAVMPGGNERTATSPVGMATTAARQGMAPPRNTPSRPQRSAAFTGSSEQIWSRRIRRHLPQLLKRPAHDLGGVLGDHRDRPVPPA